MLSIGTLAFLNPWLLAALLGLALLCACAVTGSRSLLVERRPGQELSARVAAAAARDQDALLRAIGHSLAYVRTRPADRRAFGPDGW